MLSRLHIENYVLIDSLDIHFPGGLSIITGRTGAGKSILLGALNLVLGGKAGAEIIGTHGSGCVVEADFEVPDTPSIRELFDRNDWEWEDGHVSLRRVISASGRSRSFVGDLPVQQGVLSELSSYLVDIHSQHQTRLLNDAAYQLSVLDRFAGLSSAAEECSALWHRLGRLERELETLRARIARQQESHELDQVLYERLVAASLAPGELEELEAEQKRLANAGEIKQDLFDAETLLSPPEGDGIISSLKQAEKNLLRAGKYFPAAEELAGRISSSRVELDDILATLTDLDASVDTSPERLGQVEDRLSHLYALMRRHDVRDVESLIAIRDDLASRLSGEEDLAEQEAELVRETAALQAQYDAVCDSLSTSRTEAAGRFASEIIHHLRFLELEKALFRIDIAPGRPGASGKDSLRFMFSADGMREVEIAKAASGGEMSRIMLSLKAVMVRFTEMPTMIFDEIDTGVSGSAADKMGSLICEMGRDMQVVAITHLPQVAAKGSAHFLVTRTENPATGGSVTGISLLSEAERVQEIARMLSGASLTEAAVRNAAELLRTARS